MITGTWQEVGCCAKVIDHKLIFYSFKDKKFYFSNFISYADFDQSIYCCPWCGVKLTEDHFLRIY
jgi:hypothetical protein